MELKVFLADLVTSLARLDFVVSLDLRTEVFTVSIHDINKELSEVRRQEM